MADKRERPLGDAGKYILGRMGEAGGVWHRTCGWYYEGSGVTLMLLARLAVDGYVKPVHKDGYKDAHALTDKGKRTANRLLSS